MGKIAMSVIIYHNPRCSKSRQALKLIRDEGVEPKIIEYLKVPLTKIEIRKLLRLLNLQPRELMREKEKVYINMNLGDGAATNNELIAAMISEPILIERPIIVKDDKAIIGRPPEKVLDLLNV